MSHHRLSKYQLFGPKCLELFSNPLRLILLTAFASTLPMQPSFAQTGSLNDEAAVIGLVLTQGNSAASKNHPKDSAIFGAAPGSKAAAPSNRATSPSGAENLRDGHSKPLGQASSGQPRKFRILLTSTQSIEAVASILKSGRPSANRFVRYVDESLMNEGKAWGFLPWNAALLGALGGDAKYCAAAVRLTEKMVTSEEALIQSGKKPKVSGDSYLQVGNIVGDLSLVYDWCRSMMTDAQRGRWVAYANQAVWNVWNYDKAKWGGVSMPWTGWGVSNPSNNYFYSFLEATMLLGLATVGENPLAQGWIDTFRVNKIENMLAPQFASDLTGGGSREGTGYGTALARLFKLYDWWERSTGEKIATKTTHARLSIAQMLHSIVPTLDRLTPTGDQARESTAALFDYHRDYLQVLTHLFPDDRLSKIAKSVLTDSSVPTMRYGFMYYSDFLNDMSGIVAEPATSLATAYWAPGIGQFAMRSSWTKDAAYANLICGPLTESHAHTDQGSFVLYKGAWLAYDSGIDTRSGIEQREEFHNLVRFEVGGQVVKQVRYQKPCNMLALSENDSYAYGVADITPIYSGQASVAKVQREFLFIKPSTFVVFDRTQTTVAGAKRIWTLNLPTNPTVSGDTLSMSNGANQLDVMRVAPAGLSYAVTSLASSNAVDSTGGYRVDVADSAGNTTNFLHVMSVNKSVQAVARADRTGTIGVQIQLTNGSVATVNFNQTSTGGLIEIKNASGAIISAEALSRVRQPLQLFRKEN